ncbi:hypothetical protein CIK05_15760 [Bdellovibrio sp. qaytius]|nr:hypothetical protein CIK05_15760 [Bdellovibrio sp. qaytius]
MKFLTIIVLASLALPILANAADPRDISQEMMDQLTPLNVEVRDVTEKYQNKNKFKLEKSAYTSQATAGDIGVGPLNQVIGQLTQAEIIVDKIINIGTKIWTVLEKGKPVASFQKAKANAVPQNITAWQQLEGWKSPQSKYYEITYKNVYGVEVAKLVYKIIYLSGGSYKGQGKYIGYVSVEPQEFKTAYMYTFNVQAAVESVYNKGTSENPLAGMIININWTVSTVLKTETQSYSYEIDGAGNFSAL